jgi:Rieske Fe-S protein
MSLTRRDLLVKSAAGCASFAAAGLMANCGFDVSPAPRISVSLISDSTSSRFGQIEVPYSQNPSIRLPDAAVILDFDVPANVSFSVPPAGVLLVHRGSSSDTPEYVAVAADCPHAGCPLSYSTSDRQIACPCHGSRFYALADSNGHCIGGLLRGPAAAGVRAYNVDNTDPTNLYVDLRTAPMCGSSSMTPTVVNGQVVLPFSQFPALATPGGTWIGMPQGITSGDTLIVIRVDQTTAVALSDICTHAGCMVNYHPENSDLECPCHGSRYALSGAVTMIALGGSPNQAALRSYPAVVNAQDITVTVM